MKKIFAFIIFSQNFYAQEAPKYLFNDLYFADPSVHVFNNKIYIYPSHDIQTEVTDANNGGHFNMKDYHVLSLESPSHKAKDEGLILKLEDIPWAEKQLWAPDIAKKGKNYYFYFPAKDKNGIFRIGVASSKNPEGPFKAEREPIKGTYSIDPKVLEDNGKYYIYFGGLKGGQLQQYRNNVHSEKYPELGKDEKALLPKMAMLKNNMKELAEAPKDIQILDENGNLLKAGDQHRRFFEGVWVHQYNSKYYLSYSTGETHKLVYAIGDNPYGPFTFKGEILTPVVGWTTHHSIVEIDNKWYLFYHDSKNSGGKSYLRSLKVRELKYNDNGKIIPMNGQD
ncbi:glycoside hydrolase family 43 protein [Chryseobacterium caseinilyticum]|uniref:Glycoside hydrolase family 43 protein n=1 Tax=Chryseobacterium caseinilyticum TaxID=2771428 RepID=A0ABR8ZBI5_9FLAO|nr:glycoside hydrolase family 43 protein [Chryseobacterium caseinilyticum]MBD8082670.1 glycoside hydrolase family 43 protein [Chryseobacterium caseinilyticum]